jgi:Immunity protein 8
VRAIVRRFHSPDADLDRYVPDDPQDVGLLVQMMVGPAGKPGEESFGVVACTPHWFDRRVREGGPLIGRHHLVIERWDVARVRRYLTDAVEAEEAPTWSELAAKIGRRICPPSGRGRSRRWPLTADADQAAYVETSHYAERKHAYFVSSFRVVRKFHTSAGGTSAASLISQAYEVIPNRDGDA